MEEKTLQNEQDYFLTLPLLPHQKIAVDLFEQSPTGFCNLSEMGTGKTLTTIAAANLILSHHGMDTWRVLTVCPSSLKHNWAEELKRSTIPWHVVVLDGTKPARLKLLEAAMKHPKTWVVINYEGMTSIAKELQQYTFNIIIADEAHAIKNHRSLRAKTLKALKTQCKWAMTGTPIAQNPLDIFSIFDWVRPQYLGKNYFSFRARYATVYNGAGFPVIKGWKNLDELQEKVKKYSVRFLKEDGLSLPPKTYQTVYVDLPPNEARVYRNMANQMIAEIAGEPLVAKTILTKLIKLKQITSGFAYQENNIINIGSSKLETLGDLLESLSGVKVVVWCHLREELNRIAAMLKQMKRSHVVFNNESPEDLRQGIITRFNASTEDMVFLGSICVGGVGINLQSASHCVYFSNTWSLVDRLQSEDRIHRHGQKSLSVTYYDLVARDTIDEYVLECLKKKVDLSNAITGDDLRRVMRGGKQNE